MTQSIPKPFQMIIESASGSQINAMMVRSYLQVGHSISKQSEVVPFKGALSDGFPGIYKNCLKWDVSSLYPSIILEYGIYCPIKDPNGNFLKLVKSFRELRLMYKAKAKTDETYDAMQNSFKTLINSMYGVLSTSGLNFNYPKGAEEVTRRGREILQTAIKWATGKEYCEDKMVC